MAPVGVEYLKISRALVSHTSSILASLSMHNTASSNMANNILSPNPKSPLSFLRDNHCKPIELLTSATKRSPNSEVKKRHAAISLACLFHATGPVTVTSSTRGNLNVEMSTHYPLQSDVDESKENKLCDFNASIYPITSNRENFPPQNIRRHSILNVKRSSESALNFSSPKKKSKGVDKIACSKSSEILSSRNSAVNVKLRETTPEKVANILASELPFSQNSVASPNLGTQRMKKLMEATQITSPIPSISAGECQQHIQTCTSSKASSKKSISPKGANRKEKSLALSCKNFMDLCRDAPTCGLDDENGALIELNEIATHLGVKRRRIYDIINVMESVNIVSRLKKNTYRWHGKEGLPLYFARLQQKGLLEKANNKSIIGNEQESSDQGSQRVKGMSTTCQKLIQFFLVSGQVEIGLADAAEAVLGPFSCLSTNKEEPMHEKSTEADAHKTFKTKVRRMYDIANVLTTLGIICKENTGSASSSQRPSFKWVFHILPCDMSKYLPPNEQDSTHNVKQSHI